MGASADIRFWECLLEEFAGSCKEGILHERSDGHRTYATGNGSDIGALGSYVLEVNIAAQTETALARSVGHAGGTNVDDGSAIFHHVGSHETGLAESCDDDVGRTAYLLDVGSSRVADSYGSVAGITFLHHESSHGFTDDIAAAEHYAVLALGRYLIAGKELEDTGGSGRVEAGETD